MYILSTHLLSRVSLFLYRTIHIYNREIPQHIPLPPYVINQLTDIPTTIPIKTEIEITHSKKAGSIVSRILNELSKFIKPGLSTQDIDDFVFNQCILNLVYPSPLGYCGFPKSVCTSVNEIACHGIPSSTQILNIGDIVSIDVSVYNGFAHGDACRSYYIDEGNGHCKVSNILNNAIKQRVQISKFLCSVVQECCVAGIEICAPGIPYTSIAKSITAKATQYGCIVLQGICGHGIGSYFHGPPDIFHSLYELPIDESLFMKPGHLFTIEPCIAIDVHNTEKKDSKLSTKLLLLDDNWSVVTEDSTLTAQFEEMVLITENGFKILTS